MKTNQKPVHEIRLGTVKAAIWRDQAGESIRHNVTFSRLYKKGEEKYAFDAPAWPGRRLFRRSAW